MHMRNNPGSSLLSTGSASPKAGRYRMQEIEDPAGVKQQLCVHLGESPLAWLRARGLISDRLGRAGERLREDWELAGLGPHVTMAWDVVPASRGRGQGRADGAAMQDRCISAKQRFDAAMQHSGPGLCDILWRVVCAGEGLAAAERALGWPARAGKLVLGFALERVADYYRIN